MRTALFLNLILIVSLLQGNMNGPAQSAIEPAPEPRAAQPAAEPRPMTVTLKSPTEATITFRAEHSKEVSAPQAEGKEIPHLVLNRNGVPTPGFERTLIVSLENIEVPPTGAYAQLVIETQHGDPDLGGGRANRIQVWEDTMFIPYSAESQELASLDFQVVFQRTLETLHTEFRTPTDYFTYRVLITDTKGNVLKEFGDDYAFLLENQWRVPLPDVLEATPGAAPKELVIYYYDMIPFQTDLRDPFTQIARLDVERYLQAELVPAMVAAFITQTNEWGLPWYEEWSNARRDEDPKALSVALVEHGIWYHGAAPSLGHAMISIRVDGSFGEYSDLTDGIMSVFHHELFHNQQRNISFHFGSNGNISGKEEAWKVVSEGTAVLASSVGQPRVQFEPTASMRSYLKRANAFIGSDGVFGGGLNKSYKELPYQMSLYWRFLYENCGGLNHGFENPAAGMLVIRNVLETLYKGEIVDINKSADVASAMPRILDAALQATPDCAFQTYEASLVQFAQSIYRLRLEDGRCLTYGFPAGCGFHDPNNLYTAPHADVFAIGEGSLLINGSISSSYGIDLLELDLDPSADGKSIQIILRGTSTPADVFHVEVQGMRFEVRETGIERISSPAGILGSARSENGQLLLEISSLNLASCNGLALTVIRMDPYEATNGSGHYALQVQVE
ncbi:MAG TPA: hypothetical protein VFY26_06830 [Anaerolineales bacterium]|nr:hypothetical protein [Anaerolineales bacterium]